MEFLSIPFAALISFTFILYYAFGNRRWQHALLLLSSVVFIGYYHIVYLIYALGITIFTFYTGKLIHKKVGTAQCGWLLWTGIIVLAGVWLAARYWSPLFPLGISFYTFQALSYLIEIYWEEEPEEDFLDFTLYMMLFMKFLSGPIERGYNLLPQLKSKHAFDYDKVVNGMKLIVWGVFMKLVIADRIAPSIDSVLNNVSDASGIQLLTATPALPYSTVCRLCRLHEYGHRIGNNVRIQSVAQLQPSFRLTFHWRTMATLAHLIIFVGERLCVYASVCRDTALETPWHLLLNNCHIRRHRRVAWCWLDLCYLWIDTGIDNNL